MKHNPRRNLFLALAVAAVIVGIVVAVSSGGNAHGPRRAGAGRAPGRAGELAIAARYLGMTRRQLRRRLRVETLAEAANTTTGHSAAGLEAALLAAREAQWRAQSLSPTEEAAKAAKARQKIGETLTRRRSPGALAVAAGYLGMPEGALHRKLVHGQSLASLAEMKAGTSRSGLIAVILESRAKRIEGALAAHQITKKQERSAIALLKIRVAREVDRTLGG